LAPSSVLNLAEYLAARWIDQDHPPGFENAAGSVNREGQRSSPIAVARRTEASLNYVFANRAEEQEFGGRRSAWKPHGALAVPRALLNIGRFYRAADIMISNERKLASTPTTSTLTPTNRFVVQSLAATAHIQAGKWLAPNPLISV
jgi:hypothetical protein